MRNIIRCFMVLILAIGLASTVCAQESMESLYQQLENLKLQKESLLRQVTDVRQEKAYLAETIKDLRARVSDSELKFQTRFQVEKENLNEQVKLLNEKINSLNAQVLLKGEIINDLERRVESYQTEVAEEKDATGALYKKLENMQRVSGDVDSIIAKKVEEAKAPLLLTIVAMENQLNGMEEKVDSKNSQIQEKESYSEKLNDQLEAVQNKVLTLEKQSAEKTKEIEELKLSITNRVQKSNEPLKEELSVMEKELALSRSNLLKNDELINDLKLQREIIRDELKNSNKERILLETQLNELKSKTASTSKELDSSIVKERDDLLKKVEDLTKGLLVLENAKKLNEIKVAEDAKKEILAVSESNEKKIASLEKSLEKSKEPYLAQIEELKQKNEKLKNTIDQKMQEKDTTFSSQKAITEEVVSLKEALLKKDEQILLAKNDVENFKNRLSKSKAEYDELLAQNTAVNGSKINSVKSEYEEKLKGSTEEFKQKERALNQEVVKLLGITAERDLKINSLSEQNKVIEEQIGLLTKTNKDLQDELTKTQTDYLSKKNSLSSEQKKLEEQVVQLTQKLKFAESEYEEKLKGSTEEFKQKERALNQEVVKLLGITAERDLKINSLSEQNKVIEEQIGLLTKTNKDLQDELTKTQTDHLSKKNSLSSEQKKLEEQVVQLTQKLKSAEASFNGAQKNIEVLQSERKKIEEEKVNLKSQLAGLQSSVKNDFVELENQIKSERVTSQERITHLEKELEYSKKELLQTSNELKQANQKAVELASKNAEVSGTLEKNQLGIAKVKNDYAQNLKNLNDSIASKDQLIKKLESELTNMKNQIAKKASEAEVSTEEIRKLQTELKQAKAQNMLKENQLLSQLNDTRDKYEGRVFNSTTEIKEKTEMVSKLQKDFFEVTNKLKESEIEKSRLASELEALNMNLAEANKSSLEEVQKLKNQFLKESSEYQDQIKSQLNDISTLTTAKENLESELSSVREGLLVKQKESEDLKGKILSVDGELKNESLNVQKLQKDLDFEKKGSLALAAQLKEEAKTKTLATSQLTAEIDSLKNQLAEQKQMSAETIDLASVESKKLADQLLRKKADHEKQLFTLQDNYEEKLNSLKLLNKNLSEGSNGQVQKIAELTKAYEQVNENLRLKTDEFLQLQDQKNIVQEKLKDLEESLLSKENEAKQLESNLSMQLEEMKSSNALIQSENKKKQDQLNGVTKSMENMKLQVATLNGEKAKLSELVKQKDSMSEQLKGENLEHKHNVEELQKESVKLMEQISNLTNQLKAEREEFTRQFEKNISELKAGLVAKDAEITKLQEANKKYMVQTEGLKKTNLDTQSKFDSQSALVIEKTKLIDQFKKDAAQIRTERDKLQNELKFIGKELVQAEETLAGQIEQAKLPLQASIRFLEKRLLEAERELKSKQKELDALTQEAGN